MEKTGNRQGNNRQRARRKRKPNSLGFQSFLNKALIALSLSTIIFTSLPSKAVIADPLDMKIRKTSPVLSFANKSALKYRKVLTVGQAEVLEFAKPVSLAHFGVGEESLNYIDLDKLDPGQYGYKKFMLKAKKPGYGELTFKSGKDLIKVEVIVQNDYKELELQLNRMFGIPNAGPDEKIKVTAASYIGDVSSKGNSDTYIYLSGLVANPKQALLAVAFAANAVGDKGVKIYSNPGGQLRQKDLDKADSKSKGTTVNVGGGKNASFAADYSAANKLIDTDNLNRDLILASENEKVISYIRIQEAKRFAVKVRFLEMDAKYLDRFNSAITVTGVGGDVIGGAGSPALNAPTISSSGLGDSITETLFDQFGEIKNSVLSAGLQGAGGSLLAGNIISGSLKIFENARLNASFNDLLSEGILRIANEFSLVTHSGDTVSLGKGVRFPLPQQNFGFGNTAISVEYIPIGFQGELKVTDLENSLIDAQLASRLTTAEPATVQLNGFPIPVFKEEYVNSGVILRDGQEVILNAFLTESETVAKSTSPLGRLIPFLGKGKKKERTKSLLFVTIKVEDLEPVGSTIANNNFRLPHLNIDKDRNLYSNYIRELRSRDIGGDSIDLKQINTGNEMEVDFGEEDFKSDPLEMNDPEPLPGIKLEEVSEAKFGGNYL